MSDTQKPFRIVLRSGNEIKFTADEVKVGHAGDDVTSIEFKKLNGEYPLFLSLGDVIAVIQELK